MVVRPVTDPIFPLLPVPPRAASDGTLLFSSHWSTNGDAAVERYVNRLEHDPELAFRPIAAANYPTRDIIVTS
jgi:hypothetical protein